MALQEGFLLFLHFAYFQLCLSHTHTNTLPRIRSRFRNAWMHCIHTDILTMYLFKQNRINANSGRHAKNGRRTYTLSDDDTLVCLLTDTKHHIRSKRTRLNEGESKYYNNNFTVCCVVLLLICRASAWTRFVVCKIARQNLLHLVDDGVVYSFRTRTVLSLPPHFCRIVCAWFSKYVMNDDESGA